LRREFAQDYPKPFSSSTTLKASKASLAFTIRDGSWSIVRHIEAEAEALMAVGIVRPKDRIMPLATKAEQSAVRPNFASGVENCFPKCRVG
jgi:hypothetical protein